MSDKVQIVTPADYPRALNVVGTGVTPLVTNAQTGGGEVTFQSGTEGNGPPLHAHDWDERFFVLKGAVDFILEDRTVNCPQGTLVHIPANTPHGFRYCAGGGEMLEMTSASSGAIAMFTDMDASVPPGPPDVPILLAVLARNGVSVVAPG